MRAVKMRNSGLHVAVGQHNTDDSEAADAASQRFSAAAPPSLGGTMVPDSKNTTMPPTQFHNPYRYPIDNRNGDTGTSSVVDNRVQHANGAARAVGEVERKEEDGGQRYTHSFDPLVDAMERDAPLTFTARDDPCVVARLPLLFHEMLPTIDQQLLYRQRQAAHQFSVDAQPPHVQSSTLPASPLQGVLACETYPPMPDFIRDRLPRAVGRVPGCKTKTAHPQSEPCTRLNKDDGMTTNARKSFKAAAAASESLTVLDEQRLYRDCVAEEMLEYLLCPRSLKRRNAPGDESVTDGDNKNYEQEDQEHNTDNERRYTFVESCLSGLREIPSDCVEYAEMLRKLTRVAEARAASTQQQEAESEINVDLPAYVQQLLVGSDIQNGGISHSDTQEITHFLAGAGPRVPVVASTLRATLDAVLPPRMTVYYIVSYETAVHVQQQRRAAQEQQETLRRALKEHADDQQSRATLEEVTALLTTQYAQTPIGMMLVMLERTSDVQTPREYLNRLEQSLDEILTSCHARCCGRPIHLSTSAQNAQCQVTTCSPPTPTVTSGGNATPLVPTRPTDEKKNGDKLHLKNRAAAAVAAPAAITTVLSTVKDPVCTRTTRPLPARPAALSRSGGGSASVATTLNVIELNKERRLVQFDLLGEELLRQVTVDLPERGVLLRRLLDEAQLSLDARAVLARERVRATQEHLLDGQNERERLAAAQAQLEKDVSALQERLAALKSRKAGLEAWSDAQQARTAAERQARLVFEERLRERLTVHTEAMKAAQEVNRQIALA